MYHIYNYGVTVLFITDKLRCVRDFCSSIPNHEPIKTAIRLIHSAYNCVVASCNAVWLKVQATFAFAGSAQKLPKVGSEINQEEADRIENIVRLALPAIRDHFSTLSVPLNDYVALMSTCKALSESRFERLAVNPKLIKALLNRCLANERKYNWSLHKTPITLF